MSPKMYNYKWINNLDICGAALFSTYSPESCPPSDPPKRHGCSGIIWEYRGQLWGITHGSILTPILWYESRERIESLKANLMSTREYNETKLLLSGLDVRVLREKAPELSAKIATVWRCPFLSSVLQSMTNVGWDFSEDESDNHHQVIFPMYVVLCSSDFFPLCTKADVQEALKALLSQTSTCVNRGAPLLSVSSPFCGVIMSENFHGPLKSEKRYSHDPEMKHIGTKTKEEIDMDSSSNEVVAKSISSSNGIVEKPTNSFHTPFLNSWSEGVVSATFGPKKILILTDARSTVGSEGGPVFVGVDEGPIPYWGLAGMLIVCFCSWRGEWVGFSLAAKLGPSLRHFLTMKEPIKVFREDSFGNTHSECTCVRETDGITAIPVVHVKCGPSCGSGVPVNSKLGLIVTCAHVLESYTTGITVSWSCSTYGVITKNARLIYKTPKNMAYDIGVISIGPCRELPTVQISMDPPVQGERVWSVGYAMNFGSQMETCGKFEEPLLSNGIVSTVTHTESPVLFQTTCCVQSGASGGAIVRERDQQLLGIIVCNTAMNAENDETKAIVFPHLNIAVPATVLRGPINDFVNSLNVTKLMVLKSKDEKVQRIWRLQNPEGNSFGKSKL